MRRLQIMFALLVDLFRRRDDSREPDTCDWPDPMSRASNPGERLPSDRTS